MLDYLKRTDDINEIIAIGHKIAEEKKDLYSPSMMKKMMDGVEHHIPEADPQEKEDMVYRAIYDWWVYGNNVEEEFYYGKINLNIKGNGKKINQMEKENIYILMVIII